jgi:hypothetical protein
MSAALSAGGAEANVAVEGHEIYGQPDTAVTAEPRPYGRCMTAVKTLLSGSRGPPLGKEATG